MRISEVMTRDVHVANPDQTIQQVAQAMAGLDIGMMPVGENDRLVGMITDRDIATRGVAKGRGPETSVRDLMTPEAKYCFDDDEIEDVARNMGEIQVRRLPVIDRDKRLVGFVSLGDIATSQARHSGGEALSGISRPGGEHSQNG